MEEFKDLQDLIIRGEELSLKMEDVHERQDRMRLALNRNTNNNREAKIRIDKVIEMLSKIEANANIITNSVNNIDAEKIRKDIEDSFSSINIKFDQEVINKSMNLGLSKLFKAMHLDKFASHIDSHIVDYQTQCKQIDTNIKKLQAINDVTYRLEKQIPDFEHSLSKVRIKESLVIWSMLTSLGAVSGSIITYLIIIF